MERRSFKTRPALMWLRRHWPKLVAVWIVALVPAAMLHGEAAFWLLVMPPYLGYLILHQAVDLMRGFIHVGADGVYKRDTGSETFAPLWDRVDLSQAPDAEAYLDELREQQQRALDGHAATENVRAGYRIAAGDPRRIVDDRALPPVRRLSAALQLDLSRRERRAFLADLRKCCAHPSARYAIHHALPTALSFRRLNDELERLSG